jgi:hypothetical protein
MFAKRTRRDASAGDAERQRQGEARAMGHDEIECITAAAAGIVAIMDEADRLAEHHRAQHTLDPIAELREGLPLALARFSPEARAAIRDYTDHIVVLVAGLNAAIHA